MRAWWNALPFASFSASGLVPNPARSRRVQEDIPVHVISEQVSIVMPPLAVTLSELGERSLLSFALDQSSGFRHQRFDTIDLLWGGRSLLRTGCPCQQNAGDHCTKQDALEHHCSPRLKQTAQ